MKTITTIDNPHGNPHGNGRRRGSTAGVWAAMAGYCLMSAILLLPGCSKEETGAGDDGQPVAVEFTASVATATRTTNGGDEWATGDQIGICMVTPGGNSNGDAITAGGTTAFNIAYDATPLSPASNASFSPASGEPIIYYPQSGLVDFIAYYPFHYDLPVFEGRLYYRIMMFQDDEAAQNKLDVLYAKTESVAKSKTAVNFEFAHVMSKVTLNLTAGDGISAADVQNMAATKVTIKGMPNLVDIFLPDGSLEAGGSSHLRPLKGTATGGAHASFTALIIPQPQDNKTTSPGLPDFNGRTVTFDVGGKPLVWKIPDDMKFLAGEHYSIPITLKLTGVEVDDYTIDPWNPNRNTDGDGEARQIEREANCYMVEPNGPSILIPVSQANRIYGPDGLGATTDGLNRVKAGNFTVELVWADTPIRAASSVIKEAVVDGDCIKVTPGDTPGNAVIGIKLDGETDYRWSWHIWVTEPVNSDTDTETGRTWMDRNLGATANTPLVNGTLDDSEWVKTLGLYYQWGRKDAFPGSDGTDNTRQYYTHSGGPTNDNLTGSYTELPGMVQNPLNMASNISYCGSVNDNDANNDSWGGESGQKTVYDPCPPGWRVPPVTINDGYIWGNDDNPGWDVFNDKGRVFNGVDNTAGLGHYYPAAGYRNSGNLNYTGSNGYYWSSSANNASNGWYLSFSQSNVLQYYYNRNYAFSVRCVRF